MRIASDTLANPSRRKGSENVPMRDDKDIAGVALRLTNSRPVVLLLDLMYQAVQTLRDLFGRP